MLYLVCDWLVYLTGVHASLQEAGTQHAVCDLALHQSIANCLVHHANLRLLQDGRFKTCSTAYGTRLP